MSIKYYVSNLSDYTQHVIVEQRNVCQRESSYKYIEPETLRDNFYTSENNIFCSNTYGTWRFTATRKQFNPPSARHIYFKVVDSADSAGVNITIGKDEQLSVTGQVEGVSNGESLQVKVTEQKQKIIKHLKPRLSDLKYKDIRTASDITVIQSDGQQADYSIDLTAEHSEKPTPIVCVETAESVLDESNIVRWNHISTYANERGQDFWIAIASDLDENLSKLLLRHEIGAKVWAVAELDNEE